MSLALRFAARSHTGLLRSGNEDSAYAGPRLLAVADGMGGHAAGEVASAVTIAALAPLDDDVPGPDLLDALRSSALSANEHLHDMVAGDPALEGMGTTLVALLFAGARLGLLHVGDSRCYLLRDGELTQITRDHTLVQTLVDEGRITEEEATTHPQRSLITRALDGRGEIELDLSVREARAGDRYLLCTDGLTGPVGRLETLQETLGEPDPQAAADRLIDLALRGGGPDNITLIVADVVQDREATGDVVVAGAAAEHPQSSTSGDSAASRARVAEGRDVAPEPRPAPDVAPAPARRHRGRTALVVVAVVGLVLAGAGTGWAYVRSQYYVGVDDGRVAVFRGVTGSVAGLPLSAVARTTDLDVDRLPEIETEQLQQGIVAADRSRRRAHRHAPAGGGGRRLCRHRAGCGLPGRHRPDAGSLGHRRRHPDGDTVMTALPLGRPAAGTVTPGPRTRRGTELALVVFAVGIAVLAYAAVGLAQDDRVPSGTLGYGLGLGGLFVGASLAVRRLAPYADPLILPCVALLNGLGLVLVRRLDYDAIERARTRGRVLPRSDAPLQLFWTGLGVALFVGRPARRPRPHQARPLHLHQRRPRARVPAPARPARHRPHHQRRPAVDPGGSGAGAAQRGRQAAAHRVLRRLLRAEARRAVAGQPPGPRPGPAAGPRPRARAAGLGGLARRAGARARPRQLAAVLRDLRRDALRRHRAHLLAAHRPGPVRRRRRQRLQPVRPRPAAGRRLAAPVPRRER